MTTTKNEKAKLDLFGSFKKLNSFDFDFWQNLSDEEKKQASPYVFLMWMQNSNNDMQVIYLNEFVNPYLFNSFKDNHDLAFTMLSLSTRKKQNRYQWVKRPSIKSSSAKLTNVKNVLKEYFEESERNIKYYLDSP